MPKEEVLALIPARGGSKGIPRKNIKLVAGKPLIAHSIEQALTSSLITRVIVSTDDLEIAETARNFGAEVPFMRPSEYAADDSPDIDCFTHALRWLADTEGYEPETVVQLRPTSPVRRVEVLDLAIQTFLDHPEADSLRSVSLASQTPYKMWRIDGEYLSPLLKLEGVAEPFNSGRQTLPRVYWQNGYVDITRPANVLGAGRMSGDKILAFLIEEQIGDLDYEESIPVVEALLDRNQQRPGRETPSVERHSS